MHQSLQLLPEDQYNSALIVLNGPPGYLKSPRLNLIFQVLKSSALIIIAADGAADHLADLQIAPDVVVGDLDSINIIKCPKVVKEDCQNLTDFQKCIKYAQSNYPLLNLMCVGSMGGRWDHSASILSTLLKESTQGSHLLFYYEEGAMVALQPGIEYALEGWTGGKVGVVPLCAPTRIKTRGLKWDLHPEDSYCMTTRISTSNETERDVVSLLAQDAPLVYTLSFTCHMNGKIKR